jgi:TatD DNase family protein
MWDTHCHLYVREFDSDRSAMIERGQKAGVTKFFLPAIDQGTHEAMLQMEIDYPDICFAMIGLHPCSVNERFEEEISIIRDLLKRRSFAGIGEAGLDFYWDKTYVEQQYQALKLQTELALEYDLPLILHTRDATQETIDFLATYKGRGLTGIFHCFGGTVEEAMQIIDLGFHLGIGGVLTYKNAQLDKMLEKIDLQHLVLETDAPYLTPVPYRGKRNESAYLITIAEKLANVKGCTTAEIDLITTQNAERIFRKPSYQSIIPM